MKEIGAGTALVILAVILVIAVVLDWVFSGLYSTHSHDWDFGVMLLWTAFGMFMQAVAAASRRK